jgi:hypothetical protein
MQWSLVELLGNIERYHGVKTGLAPRLPIGSLPGLGPSKFKRVIVRMASFVVLHEMSVSML